MKNATELRDPEGKEAGGDYLTPGHEYAALDLGFTDLNRIQTFYIEAIRTAELGSVGVVTRMQIKYEQQ